MKPIISPFLISAFWILAPLAERSVLANEDHAAENHHQESHSRANHPSASDHQASHHSANYGHKSQDHQNHSSSGDHGHQKHSSGDHEQQDHSASGHHQQEHASENHEKPTLVMSTPCGLVDSVAGDVQFLDSSRSKFLNLTSKSVLPCGAWVSVNQGWVQLRHQNGPKIHIGSHSFVQVPDSRKEHHFQGDHAVLYKGQMYVYSNQEGEEFNIVTAGARARLKRGKVLVIFNLSADETQLITLSNTATLENRFEPSKKVHVKAGEASSLNFDLVRVLPLAPSAISVASLKPKLADLHIGESDQSDAIRAVTQRQNRKFATQLVPDPDEEDSPHENHNGHDQHQKQKNEISTAGRKLASESPSKKKDPQVYFRNTPGHEDKMLRDHMVKRVVGGVAGGESVLYPNQHPRGSHNHAQIEDPAESFNKKNKKQDEAEKKRLIDELSRVKSN